MRFKPETLRASLTPFSRSKLDKFRFLLLSSGKAQLLGIALIFGIGSCVLPPSQPAPWLKDSSGVQHFYADPLVEGERIWCLIHEEYEIVEKVQTNER